MSNDYPKSKGNGESTITGYTVEGRYNYSEPKQFGGQILDERWRTLIFPSAPFGVPIGGFHKHELKMNGLLGYSAAQALRWWFHANADVLGSLCLETKIVKHIIKSSYKCEAVSDHELITGDDRSNIKPNETLPS